MEEVEGEEVSVGETGVVGPTSGARGAAEEAETGMSGKDLVVIVTGRWWILKMRSQDAIDYALMMCLQKLSSPTKKSLAIRRVVAGVAYYRIDDIRPRRTDDEA